MMLSFLRSGRPVSSYLSAIGRVKETRMTATLAYLTARFPHKFLPLFGLRPDDSTSVAVEESADGDRFDVIVRGNHTPVIIEGKLGIHQELSQLRRYAVAHRRECGRKPVLVILDAGSGATQGMNAEFDELARCARRIVRLRWREFGAICAQITKSKHLAREDAIGVAVAADFQQHLEENGMGNNVRGEIYLRELSDVGSIELYFKHHFYRCQPRFIKSARDNLYFAPYFTRRASERISERNLVPVGEGVTYVSRIQEVQVVSKTKLRKYLKVSGVDAVGEVHDLLTKGYREPELLVMRLGKPHRISLSSVSKRQLGFTRGALGARSCTLEDLLAGMGTYSE